MKTTNNVGIGGGGSGYYPGRGGGGSAYYPITAMDPDLPPISNLLECPEFWTRYRFAPLLVDSNYLVSSENFT